MKRFDVLAALVLVATLLVVGLLVVRATRTPQKYAYCGEQYVPLTPHGDCPAGTGGQALYKGPFGTPRP
jgi:hypothetical protein